MRLHRQAFYAMGLMIIMIVAMTLSLTQVSGITIVENGEPRAVVVIAEHPSRVAEYAAEELVRHVKKATGATLSIIAETDNDATARQPRIYVGVTEASRAQGIDSGELGPDTFILRTAGGNIYVLGKEEIKADPLDQWNSHSGTMFGIYELLERYLGVRWLWPGELGTFVAESNDLVFSELDELVEPAIPFRRMRYGRISSALRDYPPALKNLAFSEEGLQNYAQDLQIYLRRHRIGRSERQVGAGHYFSDWWQRYGQEHPEWFAMDENGRRGDENPNRGHVAMCVSNPDLHKYIVEEAWDGDDYLRIGEVDRRDYCHCDECMSWDGPQPDELPSFYPHRIISDRYARFYKSIHEKAVARNPDVQVSGYFYYLYFPAPLTEIELNANIYGQFVQWGNPQYTDFFPMSEDAFRWLKEQWRGWARTGVTIAYRPNYLHDGYVMPLVNMRQAGEFFKYAYEHGMVGVDFDSLTGQWAAHGPKLYLHMRLTANPELDIEPVLDEYYEAFGPASEDVRAYFDYWEQYAIKHMEHINFLYEDIGHRWQRFLLKAHEAFPPASFEPATRILAEAMKTARENPDQQYAERVEFLQLGLEHARIAGRLAACFDGKQRILADSERFDEAVDRLEELINFRRKHESLFIADYITPAGHERRWWMNLDDLLEQQAQKSIKGSLGIIPARWSFRIDPKARGQELGWHEKKQESEEWIELPVPAWWSETTVGGDYYGFGWYRVRFIVPEELAGQDIRIHFDGIDEQGWVYVNGKLVGEQSVESTGKAPGELWNQPFTVEVPAQVLKAGEENLLAVRVHASAGEAGIYKRVWVSVPVR